MTDDSHDPELTRRWDEFNRDYSAFMDAERTLLLAVAELADSLPAAVRICGSVCVVAESHMHDDELLLTVVADADVIDLNDGD
jgi:hypothetical protein